jgi:hypothetical protein
LFSTSGFASRNDSDAIVPSRVNDNENPAERSHAYSYESFLVRFVIRQRERGVIL